MISFSAALSAIFLTATFINLTFWGLVFSKLAFLKKTKETKQSEENEPFVSVIICARNEEKNLQKNLRRILNQNYHSFEIIVVDDNSDDNSWIFLQQFQKSCPTFRIKIIRNTEKLHPGKKDALTKGIKAAEGEWLLLTDADCTPESEWWLQKITRSICPGKEIVLGFSPYIKKAGLLNIFIRLEAVYTAIQYFSFALCGMPYMGVGRNLLYQKQLFENSGGFIEHWHHRSGDDDLFINKVADSKNTAICIEEGSFVFTTPERTWKRYYNQKRRHLSVSRFYKKREQFLLGILSGSHLIHYMGGFVLIIFKISTIFVFFLFVLRILTIWLLYALILKKLRHESLWKWIPLFDFALALYYLIFSITLLFGKNVKWK